MTVTAGALRELHRIHRQLTDLRDRLERGPKQVKASQANVERLVKSLADTKQALTRARVASDDKQLQLRQREERIDDLKAKLNSCSSNREYQALKEQIAADEQANSVLGDEILEALEKIELQEQSVAECEQRIRKATQDLEKTRARVEQEQQTLRRQLEQVRDALQQAETALPADFKRDYDRIAKARGEDALAQVEGEYCGACNQMLTPQTMNELYLSRPMFCKSCGCLLYLPEDRTSGHS